MLPSPLEFAVLALAAFRLWRLLAYDEIVARPRRRLTFDRDVLFLFLTCPWCLGFWLSAGFYLGWALAPAVATYAAVPLALSTLVGLLAQLED